MPRVRRVLAVGAAGLERELREAGFDVVTAAHAATRMGQEGIDGWAAAGHPDAVVVGLDPQLTYLRIAAAADCVRAGAVARRHQPRPDVPDRARLPARRRARWSRRSRPRRGRRPRVTIGKPGPHLLEVGGDARRGGPRGAR